MDWKASKQAVTSMCLCVCCGRARLCQKLGWDVLGDMPSSASTKWSTSKHLLKLIHLFIVTSALIAPRFVIRCLQLQMCLQFKKPQVKGKWAFRNGPVVLLVWCLCSRSLNLQVLLEREIGLCSAVLQPWRQQAGRELSWLQSFGRWRYLKGLSGLSGSRPPHWPSSTGLGCACREAASCSLSVRGLGGKVGSHPDILKSGYIGSL